MRRMLVLTGLVLAIGMGGAVAAVDYHKERETAMKTVGGSMKGAAGFATGKTPYDAAAAKAAMEKVEQAATSFPSYFPDDSKSADEVAAPAIWQNKPDFEARAAKLASDAKAAAAAADQGQAQFKTAFATVADNCKGCHQTYRLKQD